MRACVKRNLWVGGCAAMTMALTGCPTAMSGLCSEGTEDCLLIDASIEDSSTLADSSDGATDAHADGPRADAGHDASSDGSHDATLTDGNPGDGSNEDAADDGPAPCGAGYDYCGGSTCVALTTPIHCGSCTHACAAPDGGTAECVSDAGLDAALDGGSTAYGGFACTFECGAGEHVCGSACMPNADPPGTTGDSCIVSTTYGIFVAPNGANSPDAGSMASPVQSISYALANLAGRKNVYVCGSSAATYAENVTLNAATDGVSLFGGFNCTSSAWSYDSSGATHALVAPTSGVPLTITGLTHGATLTDMAFTAPDALAGSGKDSIGAFVSAGSAAVVFTRASITAGLGGSGAAGTTNGPNYPDASPTGSNGNNADSANGAGAVTCSCEDTSLHQVSLGGGGGNAGNDAGFGEPGNGQNGAPLPATGVVPDGDGGVFSGSACGFGATGATGNSGDGGQSATLVPVLSPTAGWDPTGGVGSNGQPGAVGQGGGGGSGGLLGTYSDGGTYGGGGSGGCGGCGGDYGTGGSAGGSSIGIVIYQSTGVTLANTAVTPHAGGAGGKGGDAQLGQTGGFGGSADISGCQGGAGGNGGNGGGGAGGAGGYSYGVVYAKIGDAGAGSPTVTGTTTIATGTAGLGGLAGANGGAAAGVPGAAGTTLGL